MLRTIITLVHFVYMYRLKAMKKHKEIECKTMVKELKDELKNEDRILKEAVKAAEDMARKTEVF